MKHDKPRWRMGKHDKPNWGKGDVIAIPGDMLGPGKGVVNGCHVFIAEFDPELLTNDGWHYGGVSCAACRLATSEDIHRLLEIERKNLDLAETRVARLESLKQKVCNGERPTV